MVEAIVAYRLIERLDATPTTMLVLVALVVGMLYNELWNAAGVRFPALGTAGQNPEISPDKLGRP